HPAYKPHITLAYIKPGLGQKYVGSHALEGREFDLGDLVFSSRNGTRAVIPLRGDFRLSAEWDESRHARGQPGTAGQVASKGGKEAPHEVQEHELLPEKHSKLRAAAKAIYDRLPRPVQKIVDLGHKAEHHLEAYYKAGQELAKAVAQERGLSEAHAERV